MWDKPLAVFGIPYGFVHKDSNTTPGLYRLGDQIAVIPSFSGDGMAIALHTATFAVRAIYKKTLTITLKYEESYLHKFAVLRCYPF